MDAERVCWLSVAELAPLLQRREVSPVELLEAYLARTDRLEPELNCYVSQLRGEARMAARSAEHEIMRGNYRGPLHGVPVALKDLFDLAGCRTTASSKVLADNVAKNDSTVAKKLKAAGAVIVGKTNTHEFAFGGTTDSAYFGATHNPWDTSRVPGGSSGDSAAAVAASLCTAALGSDTGGSIRLPAAFCGIVGLKPTYGRVSLSGVVPLAWSMDHAGPLTRSAADAALLLAAIAGHDPADPTTADLPVPDYPRAVQRSPKGLRLGVPRGYFFEDVDAEVEAAVRSAVAVLAGLGIAIEEVSLPRAAYGRDMFNVVVHSEAAAHHEPWLLERPQDYGADVRARLEAGRMARAVDYLRAQRARGLLREDFVRAFQRVDAIATPTIPTVATTIGAGTVTVNGRQADLRAILGRFTSPINMTGLPAISVPCGFAHGLPVGLQLVGRAFEEETILALAHAYEGATTWHERRPPV